MCELFGACFDRPVQLNSFLKEFYSHSRTNPNGWGLAVFEEGNTEIEKEPVRADRSFYLRSRLSVPVEASCAFAHIRYATIGNEEYSNCHPFTAVDAGGRRWTLIHNGTIFDYEPLNRYVPLQKGSTDSERILLYIVDCMNRAGNAPLPERFRILDEIVCSMSEGNKLNLLLYDGECMYVHTNYPESLYYLERDGGVLFATEPLSRSGWKLVPMTTLTGYVRGRRVYTGTDHGHVYVLNEADMRMLYLAFSSL